MTHNKPLCIYHANCLDGFAAAWVLHHRFNGKVDFHAAHYGDEPPDVTGRDVVLVDFSYKRDVLMRLAEKANTTLVLDHHKSAAEDLVGFPDRVEIPGEKLVAIFDMERSGAGLAWDFFFPDRPRPVVLNHIEDRDLWRFKFDDTRIICAAVMSHGYSLETFDDLMRYDNLITLCIEGRAIERKHMKDVRELVELTARPMRIGEYTVPTANVPHTMASDAGNLMAEGQPFAATYFDTPTHRVYSLRSTRDGVDVSEIAKRFGGGGHRNAAGFRALRIESEA